MKLKQIWILFCCFIIMLSTFFSIYIPLMGGNFYLFSLLYVEDIYVALFVLTVLAFGFIWIALFVASHILKWVVDLYNWKIEYKNLTNR